MSTVYVTEQGAKIGVAHQRLEVRKKEETIATLPMGHIQRLIIVGNVAVTTPALKRLLSNSVDVVFLGINGRYYGRLVGKRSPHIALRRAQYRLQDDPEFALALARRIVQGKLRNQKVLLQRRRREGQGGLDEIINDLTGSEARVERVQSLKSLLGVEGSATARYFGGFRALFEPRWRFNQRNRRPPRDPINVLLSLGYTLLTRAVESAVRTVGLDPYVGFLHADVYNRPSLALDLAEELRCVIEGLVLYVCHREIVTMEDFRPGEGEEPPVVLEREGLKRYVDAYEKRMRRVSRHPRTGEKLELWRFVELQAREVARCLRDGRADYRALIFR